MLTALYALLSTSYVAWYFETYELSAVYPFDRSYATPAEAGAPALNERIFETDDGARLVVWQADARKTMPTIVYFSGNAGTLKDRVGRFTDLMDAGFGLMAPAYRGSSGSTGAPEETLLIADAEALVSTLEGPLVFYGESLGAAVAIQLAARGLGEAVILEAPFTSIPDLVAAQFPAENLDGLITQRWDSLAAAGKMRQPLLVIHGRSDRIVPIEMGRQIFERAASAEKDFLPVADQGHTGLWTMLVRSELLDFLARNR